MISQSAQQIRNVICAVAVAGSLIACGSQPTARPAPVPAAPERAAVPTTAHQAVKIAMQQVGVPYRYGGNSPSGFDCSGLVHYSYSRAGKRLPRTTSSLWQTVRPVADNQIRAGDLLFFNIDGKVSHVGLYIGDGRFVHAPSSGKVVSVASLRSDYYRNALIRAGRPD